MDLNEYHAEIHGKLVIDYYNNKYKDQHKFKLFVFGGFGDFKPIYKYGPDDYSKPILLYFDNRHFDGVRNPNEMFGENYCLSCERPYNKASNHTMKCKQRCMLCSRIGPSFPCKSDGKFSKQCDKCKKTFKNEDCYNQHKNNMFCSKSLKCLDCGLIYLKQRKSHVCNEHYCHVCHVIHDPARSSIELLVV